MSLASDRYERQIARIVNSIPGITAKRPAVSNEFSDVLISSFNGRRTRVWIEVKMNHTDNLANPRLYYEDRRWRTTYKSPAADQSVALMNELDQPAEFIDELAEFTGIAQSRIKIPSTTTGLRDANAVPIDAMREFVESKKRAYIVDRVRRVDMGDVATKHYTRGKREPAHYMQAGDDFYRIGDENPLGLSVDIPLLRGDGDFKVRMAFPTGRARYEVMAELKIAGMPDSRFSLRPQTRKKNPFLVH